MKRLFILICLLILAPISAQAAYMDCLVAAKGRTLKWKSMWDKDRRDEGTYYRIVSVSQRDDLTAAVRELRLELQAVTPAYKKKRTVLIQAEDKARAFCNRLEDLNVPGARVDPFRNPPPALPPKPQSTNQPIQVQATPGIRTTIPSNLPYIVYDRGWVRADAPAGRQLAICRIGNRRFRCLDQHKQKYADSLDELDVQLNFHGD